MCIKKMVVYAAMIAVLALAGGCGGGQEATPAKDKPVVIVTSFYPMYISTINITANVPGVRVVNMTKPQTGCLHDYQLTPEDMKTLASADIFVANGAGMEAFLDKAAQARAGLKIVNASVGIKLLKDANGEENPHVWVSITDNIEQVKNIAAQLEEYDPQHATQYRENAAVYIKKLESLRQTMHKAVDALPNREIVTFHEAFPYFAREFNLKCLLVIEREPGSLPSPAELEQTVHEIRKAGIKALFAEPQYSDEAAQVIARETGAKVYSLDPVVTGTANPQAKDAYLKAMEKNMAVLSEALK